MEEKPLDCPGIVCWGDSLTAGAGGGGITYPGELARILRDAGLSVPVYNCGVGGENTLTILARAGALDVVTACELYLPEQPVAVPVTFRLRDGRPIAPLRQSNDPARGLIRVLAGEVSGTLSIRQESYISPDPAYFFTRDLPGQPVRLAAGTLLGNPVPLGYRPCLPVIWMGQNRGWDDRPPVLSEQIRLLLSRHTPPRGAFLVLGLTSGDAAGRAELEGEMTRAFGDRYLNLRAYLSATDTLRTAGIALTDADTEACREGRVPAAVLSDHVHFNATGYRLIAKAVAHALIRQMKRSGTGTASQGAGTGTSACAPLH